MNIGFIGAGKAGCSLGRYFKECGLEVTGYYSRNLESARSASEFTDTTCFTSVGAVVDKSDIIFLTVPDGEIESVWNEVKNFSIRLKIICHCSGALSSAVFSQNDKASAACGASCYSVHPLLAIRSRTESYEELSQAFFTIEGDEDRMKDVRHIFACTGNEVQVISARDKEKYHAGAVFVSNHVAALMEIGTSLLQECGFERERAEQVLQPLFLNNCQGIARDGVTEALTGPVERGDVSTVAKHLGCLEGEQRKLYTLLSEQLLQIAVRKHPERDYMELESFLKREQEEMGI